MNEIMLAALRRTLRSPRGKPRRGRVRTGIELVGATVNLDNLLPISFYLYSLDEYGLQWQVFNGSDPVILSPAGSDSTLTSLSLSPGSYTIKTVFSGSLAGAFVVPAGIDVWPVVIDPVFITTPNEIGPFPTPTTISPIPLDSPLVLVGCAALANGNVICREQYWARGSDSYVLAAGTKRTVSTTITSGMQQTSSHQEEVSTALGFSASAGWGPISASISGSLSSNASSFQQLVLSSSATQYESLELKNDSTTGQMYLKWQLVNIVSILGPTSTGATAARVEADLPLVTPPSGPGGLGPIATIVTAESPVLIDGPYDPMNLPPPPALPSSS